MLAAAAGLVAGGTALWHYNRGNFLYDRKLRQEQEFTIFEWRKAHAELWREDVRDIIEMTEKKMDNYLIISVLELGMCAGLFACGRLEPGTPPWLLQLYMLTLGGAFTYLLMAVWFAMHATVAAQCTSVRMLTQFVRLPIPTWKDFESARTYAQQFESLRVEDMLRVPMMRSMATGDQPTTHTIAKGPGYEDWLQDSELPSEVSDSEDDEDDEEDNHPDPWRLEKDGDERGLYELRSMPVELRRHILLARYAALQYQCYDAFSRLAMSFGTHQLLFALAHYCLGYLSIQDGSHWPAWAVSFIMMSVSAMMMYIDFSMTRWEQFGITLVVFAGLSSGTTAVHIWILKGSAGSAQLAWILPVAYSAHCAWLLLTLRACGLQETGSGAILPLKFRAVLYLDVFGWLTRSPAHESILSPKASQPVHPMMPSCCSASANQKDYNEPCSEPSPVADATAGLRRSILQRIFGRRHRERKTPSASANRGSYNRSGNDYDPVPPGDSAVSGPGGEIQYPPEDAFESQTYQDPGLDDEFQRLYGETDIVTGGDKYGGPAKAPARLFGGATKMLVALWAIALALPLEFFKQLLAHPLLADVYLESLDPETGLVGEQKEVHAVIGTDINGLPELIPVFSAPARQLPALEGGVPLDVKWPAHSAFVPRALSSDPLGQYLIVADDFGLFSASMGDLPRKLLNATRQAEGTPVVQPEQVVSFQMSPRCEPLEGLTFTDAAITCDSGLGEGGTDAQSCVALVLHAESKAATITTCPFTRGGSASKVPTRQWTIGTQWLEERETIASLSVRSPCERNAETGPKSCLSIGTSLGRVVELWSPTDDDWVDGGYMVPKRVVIERNISSLSGSLVDMPGDVIGALWWRQNMLDLLDADNKAIGRWRLPSHSTWLMMAGGGKSLYALGLRKPKKEKKETAKAEEVAKVKEEINRLKHKKHKEPDQAWVELWHFPAPEKLQEYWSRMAEASSNAKDDTGRRLAEL